MKSWRQLKVGDHVHVTDAFGDVHCARVASVPPSWRDLSGSHATTERGAFPKAWLITRPGGSASPWPVGYIDWPARLESEACRVVSGWDPKDPQP